jgi:uncharacterized protein with HEPN domain
MTRGAGILLEEILEAIGLLQTYTAGLTYEEFAEDVKTQDSVTRRLEIIGEAAKGIPEHLRAKYPSVPWRDITGARDVIVHEYFRIDLEMAWDMVQDDLPALEREVRRILAEEDFSDESEAESQEDKG